VKFPIAFPTLLCSIMLEQHPSLVTAANTPKKRESPLTLNYKLFGLSHVPDIVGTSGTVPASELMIKQEIVVALKDTCVMLDERKSQFELMIHALEKEDVGAEDGKQIVRMTMQMKLGTMIKRMRKHLEAARMLNDAFFVVFFVTYELGLCVG